MNIASFLMFLLMGSISASYVTRSGSSLRLDSSSFRFSGANIYWLGLDENVGGVAYPTAYRQQDALVTAVGMGARVIRSHTLGVSCGNPLSFETALNVFNDSALDAADRALYLAEQLGLKVVIPLTDNYRYYHGGKHCYTDWLKISDENEFYTNPTVIQAFQNYIQKLLTHTNHYTGRRYCDTDSILAWETGNELQPPSGSPWSANIATFIKSVDPTHLVLSGTYGVRLEDLTSPAIDIVSNHFYPPSIQTVTQDASLVASHQKVLLVGEYGWSYNGTGQDAISFTNAMVDLTSSLAGDLFWSLFPHLDGYGYVQHGDGFTMHYPGDGAFMQEMNDVLRHHAVEMSQDLTPLPLPELTAPGLYPLSVSTLGNGTAEVTVTWRGVALADNYTIYGQISMGEGDPFVVAEGVTDDMLPFTFASMKIKAAVLCVTVRAVSRLYTSQGPPSASQCTPPGT